MHSSRHLVSLDIIRALAIILVILFHTQLFLFGWSGVQVFFVLSGYLITGILCQKKNNPFRIFIGNFYISRCLRIFPIYYLYLIVISAILLIADIHTTFFSHWAYLWFYLSDFLGFVKTYKPASVDSHLWSLAVEEQFYLVYPMVVYWFSRRSLICVLFALVFMGPGIRYILGNWIIEKNAAPSINEQLTLYWFPLSNIDAFALGGLINQLNLSKSIKKPGTLWSIWFLVFLVIGDYSIRLNNYPGGTLGYRAFSTLNFQHVWGYTVINILAGLGIVTLVHWEERGYFNQRIATLNKYFFSPIARTSYGMYLYHPSIIAACGLLTPIIGFSLSTGLALAITFIISTLSYYWIEKPFLELKKRLYP